MVVVVLITITTGAVLLWALHAEQVPPRPEPVVRRWIGLPGPADVRRRDFPLTVVGYAPRAVDAHLREVAAAVAAMRAQLDAPPSDRAPATAPPPPPPALDLTDRAPVDDESPSLGSGPDD